jgi:deazaflavin-dependent oxidoreductase (nitroreductase family)
MSNSERIRPPWWLKYVNKVMIGLHKVGFGFGGKGPVVLTVPGRKTGKPRTTPVTPMTVDGKRYVVAGLPGSDWAANARAAGQVTLQVGRRTERVGLVEMSAEEHGHCCASFRSRCRAASASSRTPASSPDPIPTSSRPSPGGLPCFVSTRTA